MPTTGSSHSSSMSCPSPPRHCDPVFVVSTLLWGLRPSSLTVMHGCGEFDKPGPEAGEIRVSPRWRQQLALASFRGVAQTPGFLIERIESTLVRFNRKIIGRKNTKWFSESSGLTNSHLEVASHPHAYGDSSASPSLHLEIKI